MPLRYSTVESQAGFRTLKLDRSGYNRSKIQAELLRYSCRYYQQNCWMTGSLVVSAAYSFRCRRKTLPVNVPSGMVKNVAANTIPE